MLELGLIIGFFPAVGWVSSFLLPGPVQGPKKTPVIRHSTHPYPQWEFARIWDYSPYNNILEMCCI